MDRSLKTQLLLVLLVFIFFCLIFTPFFTFPLFSSPLFLVRLLFDSWPLGSLLCQLGPLVQALSVYVR